jgi:sugar lactone lactonase YvrE
MPGGFAMNAPANSAGAGGTGAASAPTGAAGQGSAPAGAGGTDSTTPDTSAPPTPPANLAALVWTVGGEGIGPGLFADARFVGVEGSGAIYVGEYSDGDTPARVQRFNPDGSFSTQWFVVETALITGLFADRNGIVYVNQGGTITRFEGATGKSLGIIDFPAYSDTPLAIALTPDNGLLTVGRTQMLRFDSSLRVTLDVDTIGPVLHNSISIDGAAVDGTGNIFVIDTFQPAVFKFDSAGTFRDQIGTQGDGIGLFDLLGPDCLAVDGRGRIHAADFDGIEVFNADGSSRGLLPIDSNASGMAVSDQNELLVISSGNHVLIKYALTP